MCVCVCGVCVRECVCSFRFFSFLFFSFSFFSVLFFSFIFFSFLFFSFRFVSFRFVSFRFVSFRFASLRIVSFRFVSLRIVSFRFDFQSPHGTAKQIFRVRLQTNRKNKMPLSGDSFRSSQMFFDSGSDPKESWDDRNKSQKNGILFFYHRDFFF